MLKYLNVGTQAGAFMILPTTFEPGQEATFTFRLLLIFLLLLWSFLSFFCGCYCLIWYNFCSTRVLSHGQAKLKSVDSTPAIIKSAIVKVSNTFVLLYFCKGIKYFCKQKLKKHHFEGAALSDGHEGFRAVWHTLHATLGRSEDGQCLWAPGYLHPHHLDNL